MQRESGFLVQHTGGCAAAAVRRMHAYRFDVLQSALLAILQPQELIGVLSLDELVHGSEEADVSVICCCYCCTE